MNQRTVIVPEHKLAALIADPRLRRGIIEVAEGHEGGVESLREALVRLGAATCTVGPVQEGVYKTCCHDESCCEDA